MRSTAVLALAGFAAAGVVPPQETIYSTQMVTITSCGPEVAKTDCPAQSTVTESHVYPVPTGEAECPGCDKEYPAPPPKDDGEEYPAPPPKDDGEEYPAPPVDMPEITSAIPEPVPEPSAPAEDYPVPPPAEESSPVEDGEICVPTESVKTISTEVLVPTVIYETTLVPCETGEPEKPGHDEPEKPGHDEPEKPGHDEPEYPAPPSPPSNGTIPAPPAPEESGPAEAGAAGIAGSVFFTGAVAAFVAVLAF